MQISPYIATPSINIPKITTKLRIISQSPHSTSTITNLNDFNSDQISISQTNKNDVSKTMLFLIKSQQDNPSLIAKFHLNPIPFPIIYPNSLSLLIKKQLNNDEWFKGSIVRSMSNNIIYYRYYREEDNILLMTAIKKGKGNYKKYDIFLSDKSIRVGIITSNWLLSKFSLCDENGNEIARIMYDLNLFGVKGPSRLSAFFNEDNKDNSTKIRYVFRNKQPTYSHKYKCYTLKYASRTIIKSIKNFQLIQMDQNDKDSNGNGNDCNEDIDKDIILQYGITGDNSYICDFKSPFSPLKAFAIGIIADIPKFLCE